MDRKQIEQGNKAILLFMGGVVGSSTKYPDGKVIIHSIHLGDKQINDFVNETRYHKSWDWLMPVVEKIESLGYKITIEGFCCVIYKQYGEPVAYCSNFDTKINATYHAVVAFLNWHNNIK